MKNREQHSRQRWSEPSDRQESHRMEHSTAAHINVYLLRPLISNYFPLSLRALSFDLQFWNSK